MWEERVYWVYLLASRRHGTLYVGVTNSLARRIWEHRAKQFSGFTAKYGVDRLVWYRGFGEVDDAIRFEKRLKRWRREWKVRLIEADNPHWDDLYLQNIAPETPVFMGPGQPLGAASGMTPGGMQREEGVGQGSDLGGRTRTQIATPSPTDR